MTAHKHASLMLQYAQDAAKTDKPWELWEYKTHDDNIWISSEFSPSWRETNEYRRKPVKWQPVGGDYYITSDGDVYNDNTKCSHTKQFGTERPTKEQAERAAVEMRRFNRLLALRDELCGDGVVDWGNDLQIKYYLIFSKEYERWDWGGTCISNIVTPYFTTKEVAQRACDMLNSGEVEL